MSHLSHLDTKGQVETAKISNKIYKAKDLTIWDSAGPKHTSLSLLVNSVYASCCIDPLLVCSILMIGLGWR